MRTRCLVVVMPLLLSGCLAPVTRRLDQANHQVESTNEILARISAQMDAADQLLAALEKQLDESNRRLKTIDKRMEVLEKTVRRFVPVPPE